MTSKEYNQSTPNCGKFYRINNSFFNKEMAKKGGGEMEEELF